MRNFAREAQDERRAAERSDLIMGFDAEPPKPAPVVDDRAERIIESWPAGQYALCLAQMRRDAALFRDLAGKTSRANMAKFYAAQELAARFEGLLREVEARLKGTL